VFTSMGSPLAGIGFEIELTMLLYLRKSLGLLFCALRWALFHSLSPTIVNYKR